MGAVGPDVAKFAIRKLAGGALLTGTESPRQGSVG